MIVYTDFNMKKDGFVGHMAETADCDQSRGVIVIMGGEKGILPGIKIAERFTDFGITGLAVSLFGADGLPKGPDQIPFEMIEAAVSFLKNKKHLESISLYGMSMGTIFAALAGRYIDGIENLILCSPTHVAFEGTPDKQHMTGHSVVTYRGCDIPFVRPDFSAGKMMKYIYDEKEKRKVTQMWTAYRDAYLNKAAEKAADLHIEKTNARILLIAGSGDEMWPSGYSVEYMKNRLDEHNYPKAYKSLIYPNASHLIGVMPNKQRNKWLYRGLPVIGLMYKSFAANKEGCMKALEASEKEVINWILEN